MKNIIKILKGTCWMNWIFMIMITGLAFISITTQLSGCGNKGNLTLPKSSSTNTPVITPVK